MKEQYKRSVSLMHQSWVNNEWGVLRLKALAIVSKHQSLMYQVVNGQVVFRMSCMYMKIRKKNNKKSC